MYVCAKPKLQDRKVVARAWIKQGGRYNATLTRAGENNAAINMTGQGKGDVYVCAKPKLQNRKVVAHTLIKQGGRCNATQTERVYVREKWILLCLSP